jgi:uncharacterized protein (DUF433 family)
MDRLWTIREAAAIAELPAKTIRATIDREGLKRGLTDESKTRAGYLLALRDLIYIKFRAEFPFALGKADKAALDSLIRGRKTAASGWRAVGQEIVLHRSNITISVNYVRLRETVMRNAAAFEWGQPRIVSDLAILSGEPVFRGTQIPLAEVTARIRAGTTDVLLAEKFPALLQVDFDYARIVARLGKRPGRPRKPSEAHRAAEAA